LDIKEDYNWQGSATVSIGAQYPDHEQRSSGKRSQAAVLIHAGSRAIVRSEAPCFHLPYLYGELSAGPPMACQGRQPRSGGAARVPLDRAAASGPIDGSGAPSVTALMAEPPVSSQCPLDAAVLALQAADVLADVLLEEG
jgi:hypothetical protein